MGSALPPVAKALLGLFLPFEPCVALSTYNDEFVTLAVQ